MFSFLKYAPPQWTFSLQSSPKQISYPTKFSSKLESHYLALFNKEHLLPLDTHILEYIEEDTKKAYKINLRTMKMYSNLKETPSEIFTVTRHSHSSCEMLGISIVICRNKAGKYLAVNEIKERGWYLPGGRVDPPESFQEAALREAKEEACIDVILKGVLKHEYDFSTDDFLRYKVVFYAEPKDEKQPLKSQPDKESLEARWVSVEELKELAKKPPYLRAPELLDWATYLDNGGKIFPLNCFEENKNIG